MAIQGDLAQILAGLPIAVPQCKVAVRQPKVIDIVAFGEDRFFEGVMILSKLEKTIAPLREANPSLQMLSDFHIMMILAEQEPGYRKDLVDFLQFILPEYKIEMAAGSINLRIEGESGIKGQLNPMNFEYLQSVVKTLFLPPDSRDAEDDYNPANDRAAQIAAKLKAGNEKRQAMKAAENPTTSLIANYVSALSIGLGLDINIIYNYTMFQVYDSYKRMTTKLAYDFYSKVATTPLMDVSGMTEPPHWIDDIYSHK